MSPRHALAALAVASLVAAFGMTAPANADPVVPGEEHCVVNIQSSDALNMRKQPNASATVITQKRYAECGITVTGACFGNWCPVEDGHSLGWVSRRYIAMVSPALYCVSGVGPNDWLNLRAYPSIQSQVLLHLPPNQCSIAFLPYAVGNWQKIRVAGWEGWASRRYLSGQ